MEEFFRQLLGFLDIVERFNWQLMTGMFFITFVGEIYIQIPFLMESVWLFIGYQVGTQTSFVSIINTVLLVTFAQLGRQLMMVAIYYLLPVIDKPVIRFYNRVIKPSRYFQWLVNRFKHVQVLREEDLLGIGGSSLGMLTALSGPIKLLLIVRRKLATLLLATLISGVIFDGLYIVLGAVFHTTNLNLTFLPLFLLAGFLLITLLKGRILCHIRNRYT